MGEGRGSERVTGDWPEPTPPAQVIYKIGIYGWRKRCLYLIILVLITMVIINLALTIWMLKVMDFSIHGMGKLRITEEGIRVEGDSEFLKALYASNIRSKSESGLHIESARNITLRARNKRNTVTNTLLIGDGKIVSQANLFELRGKNDQVVFSANDKEVFIGTLKVSGDNGAAFSKSVQTPLVKPKDPTSLRLESPTKGVFISAPKEVSLRAPMGDINIESVGDIKLHSIKGAVHINARNITLKNLYISRPDFNGKQYPDIFQLCVCRGNGKVFMSPSRGNCQATSDVCT